MTDQEFQRLLKRNITLSAEYKQNRGKPYIEITLDLIPDKNEEPSCLGKVRIDATDLKVEE